MILSTEDAVKKHIKQNTPAKLYFIYGEEDYLKKHYASMLASGVTDITVNSFNYLPMPQDMTFDMFYEATQTLPVMNDRLCVFIKDFPFNKLSDDERKQYEEYFPLIPETAVVIFLMATAAVDTKTAKWKSITDVFNKYGVCFELNRRTTDSIAKLLISSAKKRNASLSYDTAVYLINTVGDELTVLLNEFEKVCAYSGGNEITRETVDAVAVKSVEASVFDLTKAINAGKADTAYSILSTLLKQKVEPTLIIGVLAGEYIDLYRMKLARKYGGSANEISETFSYGNKSFRLRNADSAAGGFSEKRIGKMIEVISEADIKIKSFSVNPSLILEQLIAQLLLLTEIKKK